MRAPCGTLRRSMASIDPCIVHIHFASRGSTLRKMILADMVTRAGRPLVLHAHGGYFDQFHRRLPAVLRRTVDGILQRANVVIALSSRWRDFYVNECEVSPSHVTVLPNPVRWTPDVPNRAGRTTVQFLFLGRMCQRKGTYDLVNAFAALPDAVRARARLTLAGDGDLEAIRKLAEPFGEQVRVLSWVDSSERERLLAQSDVFVLPSYARRSADGIVRGDGGGVARDRHAGRRYSRRVAPWRGRIDGRARTRDGTERGHDAAG